MPFVSEHFGRRKKQLRLGTRLVFEICFFSFVLLTAAFLFAAKRWETRVWHSFCCWQNLTELDSTAVSSFLVYEQILSSNPVA